MKGTEAMAIRSTRLRNGRPLAAALTRGDQSILGRWFWTIDKTLLIDASGPTLKTWKRLDPYSPTGYMEPATS